MNQTLHSNPPRIAFIQACWHASIVDQCGRGFMDELLKQGVNADLVDIFEVPGAFDIPLLAKKLAKSQQYRAIVATGFIVDGGIYHHEYVSTAVIDGLMRVQLDTEVPVVSAVLTPHQFQEQDAQVAFFREHFLAKGAEAARACLKIMANFKNLDSRNTYNDGNRKPAESLHSVSQ